MSTARRIKFKDSKFRAHAANKDFDLAAIRRRMQEQKQAKKSPTPLTPQAPSGEQITELPAQDRKVPKVAPTVPTDKVAAPAPKAPAQKQERKKPSAFVNLNDRKVIAELDKKYKPFTDHLPIYKEIWAMAVYAAKNFTPPLRGEQSGLKYETHIRIRDSSYESTKGVNASSTQAVFSNFHFKKGSAGGVVIFTLPLLDVSMYYAVDLSKNKPDKNSVDVLSELAETKIRQVFPAFNLGRYNSVEAEATTYSQEPIRRTFNFDQLVEFDAKNQVTTANTSSTAFYAYGPFYTKEGDLFAASSYGNFIKTLPAGKNFITLSLELIDASVDPKSAIKEGVIDALFIGLTINVRAYVYFPTEFLLYSTSTKREQDFIPALFGTYLKTHHHCINENISNKGPQRITNLLEIKRDSQASDNKVTPRNLTNADNYLVLAASALTNMGFVFWCPPVDKVEEYTEDLKKMYNEEENVFNSKAKLSFNNAVLYKDVANDKFSFVNKEGNVEVIDLQGCRPLDALTIARFLVEPLGRDRFAYGKRALYALNSMLNNYNISIEDLREAAVAANPTLADSIEVVVKKKTNVQQIVEILPKDFSAINFAVSYAQTEDNEDSATDAGEKEIIAAAALIKAAMKLVDTKISESQDYGDKPISELLFYKFYYTLATKYADKHGDYTTAAKDAIELNARAVDISDPNVLKSIVVPNLPAITSLFPHQVQTLAKLAAKVGPDGQIQAPKYGQIRVDVGGGKTLIGLIALMSLRHSKLITSPPVIILPQRLVRSWTNEINTYSKGNINVVPITLTTMRHFQAVINETYEYNDPIPDFDLINRYIKSLPSNSILIVSSSYLTSYTRYVQYGSRLMPRYLCAEFFRDTVGVEALAFDEAHLFGNSRSNRSRAASVLLTSVKYSYQLTGTGINNTPVDEVGQMALINPSVLGAPEVFKNAYLVNASVPSSPLLPGTQDEIIGLMRPNAMRETHNKRKWAYLLPKLVKKFVVVKLSKTQQEFYELFSAQVLKEAMKDKSFAKLLDSENIETLAKIEQALENLYFQKVEAFVSAPDSAEFSGFVETPGADLVSPIVKAVEGICRERLKYYTPQKLQERVDYVKDMKSKSMQPIPMGGKIIVFSTRRVTPDHLWRHLPEDLKSQAILYTAEGGEKKLQAFLNDDSIRILIGSEKTINFGQNLQCAYTLISCEGRFSPGDDEQARGRIERPDPRNSYPDRAEVHEYNIVVDGTVSAVKWARLVSKIIERAKFDENDNREYYPLRDKLRDLPLLRLNLKTILEKNTMFDLNLYFSNFNLLHDWQEEQKDKNRALWKAGQLPGMLLIEDRQVTLANSAKARFTPRIIGQVTTNVDGFKVVPLAIVEQQASETDSTAEDDDTIETDDLLEEKLSEVWETGQVVETAYGYGRIISRRDTAAGAFMVRVPGIYTETGRTKDLALDPTLINIIMEPQDAETIAGWLDSGDLSKTLFKPTLNEGELNLKTVPIDDGLIPPIMEVKPTIPTTLQDETKRTPIMDQAPPLDITTDSPITPVVVQGMLGLVASDKELLVAPRTITIPAQSWLFEIKNKLGLNNFIDAVNAFKTYHKKERFAVDETSMKLLLFYKKMWGAGRDPNFARITDMKPQELRQQAKVELTTKGDEKTLFFLVIYNLLDKTLNIVLNPARNHAASNFVIYQKAHHITNVKKQHLEDPTYVVAYNFNVDAIMTEVKNQLDTEEDGPIINGVQTLLKTVERFGGTIALPVEEPAKSEPKPSAKPVKNPAVRPPIRPLKPLKPMKKG